VSRVYVVHHQQRYDDRRQQVVSAHDLSSAQQYGELVYLLPHEASLLRLLQWNRERQTYEVIQARLFEASS
jgi:hypothetical protein